jgi:hypothetical protein
MHSEPADIFQKTALGNGYNSESMLGASLATQKKCVEAETLAALWL